ncbi:MULTISPECIES: hypothetical protein [Exiguobacterium]|uniref:hypothetical protein n=1 Tax=Exiguobacterium TaxID=33986 RepID=UPI0025B8A55B|nr:MULTISPECIES: hypothetical protein [Exiguobacterium]
MINKSTPSILHGLTNETDVEQRPEEDDLGVYLPFPLKHRFKVNIKLFFGRRGLGRRQTAAR